MQWYGGVVSEVKSDGGHIRILYDNDTSEMADFPGGDIIVDAEENGKHSKSAGGNNTSLNPFIPPPDSEEQKEESRRVKSPSWPAARVRGKQKLASQKRKSTKKARNSSVSEIASSLSKSDLLIRRAIWADLKKFEKKLPRNLRRFLGRPGR